MGRVCTSCLSISTRVALLLLLLLLLSLSAVRCSPAESVQGALTSVSHEAPKVTRREKILMAVSGASAQMVSTHAMKGEGGCSDSSDGRDRSPAGAASRLASRAAADSLISHSSTQIVSPLPLSLSLSLQGDSRTGYYWSELEHPWEAFTSQGFDCDIVSENGQAIVDESSVGKMASGGDIKKWEDKQYPLHAKLAQIKRADQIDPAQYSAIFFASVDTRTDVTSQSDAPAAAARQRCRLQRHRISNLGTQQSSLDRLCLVIFLQRRSRDLHRLPDGPPT